MLCERASIEVIEPDNARPLASNPPNTASAVPENVEEESVALPNV